VTSLTLRTYPFVAPPELSGERIAHPVCIVGGGPVGLLLALELERHNIRCVVIEPRNAASEGSRATCISRRSMDILDGVGAGEMFRQIGLGWTHGRSFYRNHLVYELEMPFPPSERHWPMTNMPQFFMEQSLIDRIAEASHVDLRWHSRVVDVLQDNESVVCRVETPQGAYDLRASYVVACDGARSVMRDRLGLKLRGTSSTGRYLIADIHMPSPHWTERRAWFDPPSNRGATVLMHKQPDDIWRIDYQIIGESSDEDELDETRVTARISQHLDFIGEKTPWRLVWRSLYRAHMLALDDYRHGRIFFAGDAAHLVPIFGVRGLNSGFADANNLGWKLAAVLRGHAPDRLLDTYSPERREATMDILRESAKSTAFMTPPNEGSRLMRDAALSLAMQTDATRCLINPRQSVPYDYIASPLNTFDERVDVSGPRVGAPLSNVRLDADGDRFLYEHLGPDFTVLAASRDRAQVDNWRRAIETSGIRARVILMQEISSELASTLGAATGQAFVVRPDGHLCARLLNPEPEELSTALRRGMALEEPVTSTPPQTPAETDRIANLERSFALLSDALDSLGPEQRERFLARFALLAADELGADAVKKFIELARADDQLPQADEGRACGSKVQ
jgi:3-(3-hydroxy-phenyl)propionate hydroxylase